MFSYTTFFFNIIYYCWAPTDTSVYFILSSAATEVKGRSKYKCGTSFYISTSEKYRIEYQLR
jgi:hypothetical protein